MYYSYVMGVGREINALQENGFIVEPFGSDYGVAFPKERAREWERFIAEHLEPGYWNEYLSDDGVVFLFHLEDGMKRYDVKNYENDEVLALCEKLCERRFKLLKAMLKENHYYSGMMD